MNLFLENISFKHDHRGFKKDDKIEFKPGITLLAGDQGSGKSTILFLLCPSNEKLVKNVRDFKCDRKVQVFSIDTEKDNPRTKSHFSGNMQFQLGAMWSSHGETIRAIYNGMEKKKNVLFMIDEPESGLSIRSQFELVEKIKKCLENGCQLVLSTHSMILMREFGNIFDLEKMEYTTFEEFMERQQNETWVKPKPKKKK